MNPKVNPKDFLSLYFHIPFCQKKCPYCHFYSQKLNLNLLEKFLKALKMEWQQKLYLLKNSSKKLASIYFGGGTPSLLDASHFSTILSWIQERFPSQNFQEIEITCEMNPNDVVKKKIDDFFHLGINRLSLGVQTFDDELLKILQRNITSREISRSLDILSEGKIKNLSIDLLMEIPRQTFSSFEKSFEKIEKWPNITHISLYNLVFEPHTLFHLRKEKLTPFLPSESESFLMLKKATSWLALQNFTRYEISAFAKNGFESKHNLGYWTGRPFLGFGPSAFSYFDQKRFQNVCHLEHYIQKLLDQKSPIDFEEKLSFPKNFQERLLIGLRQSQGVVIENLEEEFSEKIPAFFLKNLKKLEKEKFLKIFEGNQRKVVLTEKGKNFYDTVAEKLI